LLQSILALRGLNRSPAILNSLSHAAEAGRGVFNLMDTLQTEGKVFSRLVWSAEHARYPSSSFEVSCAVVLMDEKKNHQKRWGYRGASRAPCPD